MNNISHDSEVPAQGQQVVTVCGFIHQRFDGVEKIFLPKRASTKKFLPDVHELPGGHVDFGEDPVIALRREIEEEFDMEIEVGDPFFVFSYNNEIKGSHSFEIIYFARFKNEIGVIKLNPEDHSEYGWFSEDELENAATLNKNSDDVEFSAMRKGFALLRGESLTY